MRPERPIVPMVRCLSTTASVALLLLAGSLATAVTAADLPDTRELPLSPLREALEAELTRTMERLAGNEVAPYFIGYAVYEVDVTRISASFGAVTENNRRRQRLLFVDLRVGDYALDNTHPIRGDMFSRFMSMMREPIMLPLEDDPDALRAAIWRETDRRYRKAVEMLAKVKSNRQVKVEEQDKSASFSKEDPVVDWQDPVEIEVDVPGWEERLRRYSAVFASDPRLLEGQATLSAGVVRRTLVTSEGTRIQTSSTSARLAISGVTKAEDGMELPRFETAFAFTPQDLPGEEVVLEKARQVAADLAALRDAPLLDPYTGPAILSGRSAGVFFHEIFGHRIEGHRMKDEEEGQTFKEMVGQPVLPEFISVRFDPTVRNVGSTPAAGYFDYDDQGIPARPVYAVKNGVLESFLMSRAPIEGFPRSNGHGRAQPGLAPVGRQSNLIVEASEQVTVAELRELLREKAREQGKEFGLVFEDIAGGFTFTGRSVPNAFTVLPVMVWRVYVDDRPDELVRGADLIGTPLTSFSSIIAAADDLETFNGTCGAESGAVPVSASSPSLLVERIEVQKKEKSAERPPILPAPAAAEAADGGVRR